LNHKAPCIEVYVTDEDTGEGRWCEAEPQCRIVDTTGNDAYLCVEYDWGDELYVQDFGPQHVRRRGQQLNVAQMLENGAGASKANPAKEVALLEDTVPMRRNARDNGAGVSDWLDDSV